MPDLRVISVLALTSVATAGFGCAHHATPPSPGVITHVVLISLNDPADVPAVIRDCESLALGVPGVVSSSCGPPFKSARGNVDGSYDVGFVIGFDAPSSLQAYWDNPMHVALVEKWSSRVRSMRVFDVIDKSSRHTNEGAR